jgi:hypothetical protein
MIEVEEMSPTSHLRTETDPVSETLCSLEYRTMDNVQKPSNSEYYTPPLEPFRVCSIYE